MPRYYFHTDLGTDVISDNEGVELRDAEQAHAVALETAQATISEAECQDMLLIARLVVMDEAGNVVVELPFAEAAVAAEPTSRRTVH